MQDDERTTPKGYLTTAMVCERYRIVPKTLRRWVRDKRFPQPVNWRGHNYYPIAQLEKWEREVAPMRIVFDAGVFNHDTA